jgi:micrococcal nuclease
MRKWYQILLPLLSLFWVRVDLTDLFPLFIPVQVLKIYDGDTVLVGHGNYRFKVRLSRIDSPEKGQKFLTSSLDAGEVATNCASKLVSQKSLLKIERQDIYGRILGDLEGLSLRLVEEGCAGLYPHAEFSSKAEKFKYLKAYKKAKASRRGLWQYGGFIQPKIWRKASRRSAGRR